jgi:anti-anti-sigma factor
MSGSEIVRTENVDGVLVARLVGEVDLSNISEITTVLTDGLAGEERAPGDLVLDLSETSYIDSAGINLVYDMTRRMRRRGRSVRLVVPESSPVRRVLTIASVNLIAPFDPSLAASLGELRSG